MLPLIRLWPFRSHDPVPGELPVDLDELRKCLSPVWVDGQHWTPGEEYQLLAAARALCDIHPDPLPGDFLEELGGKPSHRRQGQIEDRYPTDDRYHRIDIVMAEELTEKLLHQGTDDLPEEAWRPWAEVLELLFAERFPTTIWKGEEQPMYLLHLWAPPESVLGALATTFRCAYPNIDAHAGPRGPEFAARATKVATNAAVEFLETLIAHGHYDYAAFFLDRFVFPPESVVHGLVNEEDPWTTAMNDLLKRFTQVQTTIDDHFAGTPRALYVAIDGGGTRTTITWKAPLRPAVRVQLSVALTGAGSPKELEQRVQQVATEIGQRTADVPDRDAHGTVVAIGAAAGSPGELLRIKPMFKQAFEHQIPNTDLLLLNDGDIILTAERLAREQFDSSTAYPVMVLIVGTGSVLAAQRTDGRYLRLDGEQWIASDRCSATQLARNTLMMALNHEQLHNRTREPDVWRALGLYDPASDEFDDQVELCTAIVEHYGFANIADTVNEMAREPDKASIASVARIVSHLADEGNRPAQALVQGVAKEAAAYATAGRLWVTEDSEQDPILVVIGSIAKGATWQNAFVTALGGSIPPETLDDDGDTTGSNDDATTAPTFAIENKRTGWSAPGFRIIRPEVDGATAALRVARLWANNEDAVTIALGDCAHVATHGGGRNPRNLRRTSTGRTRRVRPRDQASEPHFPPPLLP